MMRFMNGLIQAVDAQFARKAAEFTPEIMRHIEKAVLLETLDQLWREHLLTLEHLRQVIGLRGYGQRDPLNEYKTESFTLFESMLAGLREATTAKLFHVELAPEEELPSLELAQLPQMEAHHEDPFTGDDEFQQNGEDQAIVRTPLRNKPKGVELDPNDPSTWGKVGRNAPCPCGSGKKFKHCHGRLN